MRCAMHCSPWVKVVERPGAQHGNISEEVYIENPYKNKDSKDVSADVPEKVTSGTRYPRLQHLHQCSTHHTAAVTVHT
jgi:hypothetical protein